MSLGVRISMDARYPRDEHRSLGSAAPPFTSRGSREDTGVPREGAEVLPGAVSGPLPGVPRNLQGIPSPPRKITPRSRLSTSTSASARDGALLTERREREGGEEREKRMRTSRRSPSCRALLRSRLPLCSAGIHVNAHNERPRHHIPFMR